MRLLTKLLLPVITMLTVALLGTGYSTYMKASRGITGGAENVLNSNANAYTETLENMLDASMLLMNVTATGTHITTFANNPSANTSGMNEYLKLRNDALKMFTALSLVNAQGTVVASSLPSYVGRSVANDAFFRTSMTGQIFLSTADLDSSNAVMSSIAFPIASNTGQVAAVLWGHIDFQLFTDELFADAHIGKEGLVVAIDLEGRFISHPNTSMLWKTLPITSTLKGIANSPNGLYYYSTETGKEMMASTKRINGTSIVLLAMADKYDILSELYALQKTTGIVMIVAIVLGGAMMAVIVLPIINAVTAGSKFATAVADGNLDEVLNISRNDEIGDLANALRTIPQALKGIIKQCENSEIELYHGDVQVQMDSDKYHGDFKKLVLNINSIMARYRSVLDILTSPIVILDKDLHITYMNTVAQDVAGKDYQGKTCMQVMAREDSGSPADALAIAASTLKVSSGETVAHPQGKSLDISYTAIPFLYEGKLSAVVQLITDLTSIKGTQRTIVEVANEARNISERMATASEQLSRQVGEVTRGAEIQRERVTSTATAMDEMNATVLEVANNASEANTQSNTVRSKASEGASLVNQVVAAIKNVNNVASELENNMQTLGEQAENIGSVMNVITDIADQTNLLALNAAIEAARAGEAGRGFAVVADEVRKLAEKTMTATTEVGLSIRGVQESTRINIGRVSESTEFASKATELAGVSGQALEEILTLVNANTLLISSIATAAEEQSATSEEINRAVDEINQITGETANGMTQSSQAVNDLSSMAQELRQLLERLQSAS